MMELVVSATNEIILDGGIITCKSDELIDRKFKGCFVIIGEGDCVSKISTKGILEPAEFSVIRSWVGGLFEVIKSSEVVNNPFF